MGTRTTIATGATIASATCFSSRSNGNAVWIGTDLAVERHLTYSASIATIAASATCTTRFRIVTGCRSTTALATIATRACLGSAGAGLTAIATQTASTTIGFGSSASGHSGTATQTACTTRAARTPSDTGIVFEGSSAITGRTTVTPFASHAAFGCGCGIVTCLATCTACAAHATGAAIATVVAIGGFCGVTTWGTVATIATSTTFATIWRGGTDTALAQGTTNTTKSTLESA